MIRNIIPIGAVTPISKVFKVKSNQQETNTTDKSKEIISSNMFQSEIAESESKNNLLPFIEHADEIRVDKIENVKEKIKTSFYNNTNNWVDSLMKDLF